MNINEYTNSLIKTKRESIKEATVEELKKAAALHAAKTQNVEKGLSKVASIANRIKSKVNKESTEGGSGIGKKIAIGAGTAGVAMAGAAIAKKIADKKKEKEQKNIAESVLIMFNESAEKTLVKPSSFSINGTMIHFVYYESHNSISQYPERLKVTIDDFKKRLKKYMDSFAKDHLEVIKDDFEITDLKDDGYEIPTEADIKSKMKLTNIEFYISPKGHCSYSFWLIADKIPSGEKNITAKSNFKIKYDKDNNWIECGGDPYKDQYQMDTDYHRI